MSWAKYSSSSKEQAMQFADYLLSSYEEANDCCRALDSVRKEGGEVAGKLLEV